MLVWPDADNFDGIHSCTAAASVSYDTSSGDSCWVRQYLEWCEAAATVWPEDVCRLHSRTMGGVHAIEGERTIAILRPQGLGMTSKLSMDGEGETLSRRHSPIA